MQTPNRKCTTKQHKGKASTNATASEPYPINPIKTIGIKNQSGEAASRGTKRMAPKLNGVSKTSIGHQMVSGAILTLSDV